MYTVVDPVVLYHALRAHAMYRRLNALLLYLTLKLHYLTCSGLGNWLVVRFAATREPTAATTVLL